jgi:hypothetical protein
LIHEEIELAKAEIGEKAMKLARGAVVGVAAGIFLVMALMFALIGFAWLLYYYLPGNEFAYFWGFFAMAVILLLLGALAGLLAARAVRRGAPPVPSMAIEEARKIRDSVSASPQAPHATPAQHAPPPAPVQPPPPAQPPAPAQPPVPAQHEPPPVQPPAPAAQHEPPPAQPPPAPAQPATPAQGGPPIPAFPETDPAFPETDPHGVVPPGPSDVEVGS